MISEKENKKRNKKDEKENGERVKALSATKPKPTIDSASRSANYSRNFGTVSSYGAGFLYTDTDPPKLPIVNELIDRINLVLGEQETPEERRKRVEIEDTKRRKERIKRQVQNLRDRKEKISDRIEDIKERM